MIFCHISGDWLVQGGLDWAQATGWGGEAKVYVSRGKIITMSLTAIAYNYISGRSSETGQEIPGQHHRNILELKHFFDNFVLFNRLM